MPEIIFMPDQIKIHVRPGTSLLEAARKARVSIRNRCGGNAACLMCKVIVEEQSGLAPMKPNEELKLGELKEKSFRLACQAKAVGGVTVTVPEDPLKAAIRAQLARQNDDD